MQSITPKDLKVKIDSGETPLILDVREPFELYQSKIDYEHASLIPLGKLSERLDEIDSFKNEEVVCLCRSGSRSEKACKMLEEEGFKNVKNLEGGINRWAKEVDNSLPVY